MTKKFILGSGVVGMLAKTMLGDDWTVIPFNRSRFFSFRPALDDNFIIRDSKIDDFIKHLGGNISFMYKTMYSLGGQLLEYNDQLCNAWLGRIFGADAPPVASAYMKSRNTNTIYDIKTNRLYESLQSKYEQELKTESEKGEITSISDHHFVRNDKKIDFDQIVSTIPLTALYKLMDVSHSLVCRQIWYYHVYTKELNLEGANQTLIVDDFEFFKCANISENRYMFYCVNDLHQPGAYFMQFMRAFDLIDGTTIKDALICGDRPSVDLKQLEDKNIFCVGGYAEHDWAADVGSNIMRLLQHKGTLQN